MLSWCDHGEMVPVVQYISGLMALEDVRWWKELHQPLSGHCCKSGSDWQFTTQLFLWICTALQTCMHGKACCIWRINKETRSRTSSRDSKSFCIIINKFARALCHATSCSHVNCKTPSREAGCPGSHQNGGLFFTTRQHPTILPNHLLQTHLLSNAHLSRSSYPLQQV